VSAPDRWIEIARVGRPFGVHGQVHLHVHHPGSPLWRPGLPVRAAHDGMAPRRLTVAALQFGPTATIARFEGIDDRDAAAGLTLAALTVAADALPPVGDGEVYAHALRGAPVLDADSGRQLGRVVAVVELGRSLLQIALDGGGEALVPVDAEAVVALDVDRAVVRAIDDWRSDDRRSQPRPRRERR